MMEALWIGLLFSCVGHAFILHLARLRATARVALEQVVR